MTTHEQRTVRHVSGSVELLSTCVCGKVWPCIDAFKPLPADTRPVPGTHPDTYHLRMDLAALTARVVSLERPQGKPGTGACMCKVPPESMTPSWCRELSPYDQRKHRSNGLVDHRCPKHGETAQPALWGRHRDRELLITPDQWDSLGVTYEKPEVAPIS